MLVLIFADYIFKKHLLQTSPAARVSLTRHHTNYSVS